VLAIVMVTYFDGFAEHQD